MDFSGNGLPSAHLKVQGVVAVSWQTDMERLIQQVIMENQLLKWRTLGGYFGNSTPSWQTEDLEVQETSLAGIIQVAEVEVAILWWWRRRQWSYYGTYKLANLGWFL